MRKHRRYGVAFAMLLGTGLVTHRPSVPHQSAAVAVSDGVALASATLAADSSLPPRTPGGEGADFVILHDDQERAIETLWSWKANLALQSAPLRSPTPPAPSPTPAATPVVAAPVRAVPVVRAPAVLAAAPAPSAPVGGVWAALRRCESGGDYADDSGNGYYGAYQFSLATWRGLGLGGLPSQAAPALQDLAARRLEARSGWGQWPVCSQRLGLT